MKVLLVLLLVVVAVFSLPSWCNAQDRDGNKLLLDCGAAVTIFDGGGKSLDTDKFIDASRCIGLMQGMFGMNDFYGLTGATLVFCRPNNSTAGQAARIVVKYLQDHPEQLHQDEFGLAVAALQAAFPCTNKK